MYKIISGLRLIIGFRNQTRLMFINDSKTVETNESLDTFFKDIKIISVDIRCYQMDDNQCDNENCLQIHYWQIQIAFIYAFT